MKRFSIKSVEIQLCICKHQWFCVRACATHAYIEKDWEGEKGRTCKHVCVQMDLGMLQLYGEVPKYQFWNKKWTIVQYIELRALRNFIILY